ncbi:DUF4873 domain-containing protein [Mycobacterium sp. SM1]|nr:DUF4873 domain-containing protein [Mycobacterium sp. SM1]
MLERAPRGSVPPALHHRLRLNHDVSCLVFDDDTDTWTLKIRGGEVCRARVVIAAHQPGFVPWIPDFPGRNDFRGPSFHAAAWDHDFDPAGKRIAVIGVDTTAATHLGRLTSSAAVMVFAQPPRRVIPRLPSAGARAKSWLRRRLPGARLLAGGVPRRWEPQLVGVTIDAVTASGVRTRDGVHHDVDAIIYGTGFTIPDEICGPKLFGARGVTIRRAWCDGMEPYHGVAIHGFPNYFLLAGPGIKAQTRYIVGCLALMMRAGATRIEVRRSSQRLFNERVHLRSPHHRVVRSAFDLSSGAGDDAAYDGAATLTIAGTSQAARVRLAGYLDPVDGQYHWRGIVFDHLSAELVQQTRTVIITVGDRSATGQITEQTPWASHSIVGVGTPPFAVPAATAAARR